MLSNNDLTLIKQACSGYKHHWVYQDNGRPTMVIARYDYGDKKTYRQFHLSDKEWKEGTPPSPYSLFGLHTLGNQSPFEAILIVEGEKCAEVLHQLGWPALSSPLGAQNAANADWNPIRYFNRFIILRDNDKSGISYAKQVSTEIRRVCSEAELLVVNLCPEIQGGDLVDWLQSTVLKNQGWDGFRPMNEESKKTVV